MSDLDRFEQQHDFSEFMERVYSEPSGVTRTPLDREGANHLYEGFLEVAGVRYDFSIKDGNSNGTDVQYFERVGGADLLAEGRDAAIIEGLRRIRHD